MITPSEFKERCGADEARIEAQLDRILAQHAATDPGRPVRIDMRLLGERSAAERVLDKFRKAGWRVDVVGDWRDGERYVEMRP